MKIGIYGGTFNPIHKGHVHILKEFTERIGLDMVLLIPTHVPPHKASLSLASPEDRIAMCRLALDDAGISCDVSDIEIKREGKSYTALTLQQLRQEYPNDEFYLLMGEDMFMTIQKWYHPEIIFEEATICGTPRSDNGYLTMCAHGEELKKKFGTRYIVENIPYFSASSTEIRENMGNREKLMELLPVPVMEYILERNIY